jgi:hypothetical protein
VPASDALSPRPILAAGPILRNAILLRRFEKGRTAEVPPNSRLRRPSAVFSATERAVRSDRRRAEAVLVVQYASRSPPATDAIAAGVAHPFDAASVPLVTDRVRSNLADYAEQADFKEIAISHVGWRYPIWSVPSETHLTDVSCGTRRATVEFMRSVSRSRPPFRRFSSCPPGHSRRVGRSRHVDRAIWRKSCRFTASAL